MASAIATDETKLAHELIPELEGETTMPFDFKLVKLSVGKKGLIKSDNLSGLEEIWLDYQLNSLAWPIMSEKLKSIIEKSLTGNENIDWIKCQVNAGTEQRTYFILRFNRLLDVLDMDKTMFVTGTDAIIKQVLSLSKVKNYNIFMASTVGYGDLWKITPGLYISESLKKAIEKEKLTGIDFEKTAVV